MIFDHLDRIGYLFLQLPHRSSDIRLSPTREDLSALLSIGRGRKISSYLPGTIFPKMFWFPDPGPSLGGREGDPLSIDGWGVWNAAVSQSVSHSVSKGMYGAVLTRLLYFLISK